MSSASVVLCEIETCSSDTREVSEFGRILTASASSHRSTRSLLDEKVRTTKVEEQYLSYNMGLTLQTIVLIAVALVGCSQVEGYTLATSECRSQSDCGPGECCVLGMMRYSMAQCMPLGQVEDYCRDDNPPENRTLYYPNGEPVEVVEIYTHVCPCDESLQCTDNFCALDDSYENNYLY